MGQLPEAILDALEGKEGHRQKLIAETSISITEILLRKNKDYGDSVFKTPILAPHVEVLDAILVRASDKIGRFRNLKESERQVTDESILDTLTDLIGYLTLYLTQVTDEDFDPDRDK